MRKINLMNSAAFVLAPNKDEGSDDNAPSFDVKAIKAGYKETTGKALPIKDSILTQLLEVHPEFFDDMDDKEQIKFLSNLAEQAKDVAITDPAIGELVAKIDTKAEKEILACVESTIKAINAPMYMLAVLRRIYTRDEILGMASPGLEKAKQEPGDNRKPDIVVTKLKGTGDEVTTVWTDTFCSTWAPCKQWETDLNEAKKEKNSAGSIPRYKHLGKTDLDNIIKLATKRRNTFRSMVKRAIKLEQQLAEIESMPNVVLEFGTIPAKDQTSQFNPIPVKYGLGDKLTEKDCVRVTLSPSPFAMYPKGEGRNSKTFSVTQINNMDVRAAIAAGGEMSDLTDTIAKGPDDTETDETDGSDLDTDEAYTTISQTVNWLSNKANLVKVRKILADKDHPDRADWLELVGELATAILPTYRRNKAEYEKLAEIQEGTAEDVEKAA